MKRIIIFFSALCVIACSQPRTDSALLQDYDYFFEQLEEIHPDPYSAFGGEKQYRKAVANLRRELSKRDSLTMQEMQYEVNALLSNLHDGHTRMGWPDVPKVVEHGWIPLNFRVIPDGLIVNAVAPEYKALAGSKLREVAGEPLEAFLTGLNRLVITENIFGLYNSAADYVRNTNTLRAVFPKFNADSLTLGLTLKDGRDTTVILPFYPDGSPVWKTFIYPPQKNLPRGNHDFAFLDEAKSTMYYRMSSVTSADVPGSEDPHVVAEVFKDMLTQMKDAGSSTLIIDLRGNGGGYTSITYAALYELYGDAFLQKDFGVIYRTKISQAYLNKQGNTLEQFNENNGTALQIGDFLESDGGTSNLDYFMTTRPDILLAQNGAPIYTPESVCVVTNARTFSAAFHFAYFLSQMGAKLVGVPSGQAPNTFMEATQFTLPNSGLNCNASNSTQIIFPENDKRAHILWPDTMLSYEDYRDCDFNLDVEIATE